MLLRPGRYNWPLTPGHRGIDEGLEIKLEGWIEGTDESSRRSSRKPIYVKKKEKKRENTDVERKTDAVRQRWMKCRFQP